MKEEKSRKTALERVCKKMKLTDKRKIFVEVKKSSCNAI